MASENKRIGIAYVVGWVLLSVAVHGYAQQTGGDSDIKKIIVVDANGTPVSDAKAYRGISFAWDEKTQAARWVPAEPLYRANADGELFLKIARLGNGSAYLITNDSLDLMASLYVPRRDTGETLTIRLEPPARLKAVFESGPVAMNRPDLSIGLYVRDRAVFADFITMTYAFQGPVHQVPLDVPCPSGCYLQLTMIAEGMVRQVDKEIPLLNPGQVLDLGSLEPPLESGYKVFSQDAPELQVGQWVQGEPVTLAELRGKVVLVDFWGLWCGPCVRFLPSLVSLHEKYAKDGLVIIAVHDASQTRESLLDKSRRLVDLSKLPFRIAVDSSVEGIATPEENRGRGRTIDAYGITRFPTFVIIDRDGRVLDPREAGSEEAVYSLLYGRPMPNPTTPLGRLLAAHRGEAIAIGTVAALILILLIVLLWLLLRRSNLNIPES